MKKSLIFNSFILFSLFFLSCSNNQTLKISYQDTETLKEILKEKETDTKWVQELEEDKLTKNLNIDSSIVSKEIEKNNQVVKILKGYQKPVYPQIEDFGLLDSTILNKNQKKVINDFITHISTDYIENPEGLFVEEFLFNYQFFIIDLKSYWKSFFNENIPEVTENNKVNLFNKWIIGQPTKFENQILIPVRVYTNKGYMNLLLSTTNDVSLKLYNVQIEKVGENNGN